METEQIIVNLDKSQKTALLKKAALQTANSGQRVSMSDLVRAAIDLILSAQTEEAGNEGKTKAIKFTPIPPVKQAIDRAHLNSGKPIQEVINELLVQALELSL